jgi:hypothetical protein
MPNPTSFVCVVMFIAFFLVALCRRKDVVMAFFETLHNGSDHPANRNWNVTAQDNRLQFNVDSPSLSSKRAKL